MNIPSATTYAAIESLHTALRQLDPPAARRAELRAELVRRLGGAAGVDTVATELAAAAAIVSEVGLLTSRAGGLDDLGLAARSAALLEAQTTTTPLVAAVRHQHERWDGTGGPDALTHENIPLAARLVAVANAVVAYGGPIDQERVARAREQSALSLDPTLVAYLSDSVIESLDAIGLPAIDDLAALRAVGQVLEASRDQAALLQLLLDELRVATGAADAAISRLGDDRLEWVATSGPRFTQGEQVLLRRVPNVSGLHRGRPSAISLDDGPDASRYLRGLHAVALQVQTIAVDGATWGNVVAVWEAPPSRTAAAALHQCAREAATAISCAERLDRLERWALRDAMTGLGNRRLLEDRLGAIFTRPPIERRDCALLMIDVDGLKVVNDTFGHSAGDRLLVAVADSLVQAVADRPRATVCRIGGDEFCIILDGGGLLFGEVVSGRVAQLVRERDPNYSVSIGLAHITAEIKNTSMLLRAADLAQYEQKRQRKGFTEPPAGAGRRARRDS